MAGRRRVCAGAVAALLALAAPAAAASASPDAIADVADLDENPFPAFDDFAWRAFLALNWPAGASGEPDRAARLSDPGPRVWERFIPRDGVLPCNAGAGEKTV